MNFEKVDEFKAWAHIGGAAGWTEVRGPKWRLVGGLRGMDVILHKKIREDQQKPPSIFWVVTETSTGLTVGDSVGYETREEAVKKAEEKIAKYTDEYLKEVIEKEILKQVVHQLGVEQ